MMIYIRKMIFLDYLIFKGGMRRLDIFFEIWVIIMNLNENVNIYN